MTIITGTGYTFSQIKQVLHKLKENIAVGTFKTVKLFYFSFQSCIFYLNLCLTKFCYSGPGASQDWTSSTTLILVQFILGFI